MELFPAANEDQWSLIKRVIDDSDYYVVVVGGRYGSIGSQGISYTQMELNYAKEKGKYIIGLVVKDISRLEHRKVEQGEIARQKLEEFKSDVKNGRIVRFWENKTDIQLQLMQSLTFAIREHPGVGWAKADELSADDLRMENLELKQELLKIKESSRTDDKSEMAKGLSCGNDSYDVKIRVKYEALDPEEEERGHFIATESVQMTWDGILAIIGPKLMSETTQELLYRELNNKIIGAYSWGFKEKYENEQPECEFQEIELERTCFETIMVQYRALGIIAISDKKRSLRDRATYFALTSHGESELIRIMAIKKSI
jgi:hypothetical protein